jgi:hypothetical protein
MPRHNPHTLALHSSNPSVGPLSASVRCIPANAAKDPPVLDVHAPHEAVHTWRDFFIHIATIAIGLEQTVEFFHHRHQVAETRAALESERRENIRRFHHNVEQHIMTMAYLHNNLRIVDYLRATSQQDIDHARAFAGLPPESPGASFRDFTNPKR